MAIVAIYKPDAMTLKQYYDVAGKIEKAGLSQPRGRLYHLCYGESDHLRMLEVWQSQGELDAYRERIVPILKGSGITPGKTEMTVAQNIII